ncbi:hypothetical protein HYU06_01625 [Candidatus Woesearchaeota archaeon]|nr:hypothetical protein [Candidatus Woesearchaeota archaeon]
MREWDEHSNDVSKIMPDKEKAKSLLELVKLREKDLKNKSDEFATLIIEGYYEQIKELITAIMSIDGYKTVSHELLVGYLARFYTEFSAAEIYLIDQLRKTRNDIDYRGILINPEYLKRNKANILAIIAKLKEITSNKFRA